VRILFGLGGLLVVLDIVAMMSKKQLSAVNEIKVPTPVGASVSFDPNATVKQQSQQIQQQYKQAIESAVQQPRVIPDDKYAFKSAGSRVPVVSPDPCLVRLGHPHHCAHHTHPKTAARATGIRFTAQHAPRCDWAVTGC
jgi:hypothetical protein